MHIRLVQLDLAALNVPGALREDFSLVGQERERDVIDGESKLVCPDIIENRNLPLGLTILQFERKHPWLSELLAIQIVQIKMNETVRKVRKQQEQVEVVNRGMKGNHLPSYSFFGLIQADF